MANLKDVVYLTEQQYETLIGGSEVGGRAYDENDLYLVPSADPTLRSSTATITVTDEGDNAFDVNLNSELVSKLERAIVTPVSAPTNNQVVVIGTDGAQTSRTLATTGLTQDQYIPTNQAVKSWLIPTMILTTAGNAEVSTSTTYQLSQSINNFNILMIQISDSIGSSTKYTGARFIPVIRAALNDMTNNTTWYNIGSSSIGFKFTSDTTLSIEKYGGQGIYGLRIYGIK